MIRPIKEIFGHTEDLRTGNVPTLRMVIAHLGNLNIYEVDVKDIDETASMKSVLYKKYCQAHGLEFVKTGKMEKL